MPKQSKNSRNRSTVESTNTEAVIEFTSVSDSTQHRFRFVSSNDLDNMHRIHEIKFGRQWQTIGTEVVDRLRFDIVESGKFPVE